MKVAISSKGEGLGASVDPRFGRAPCFVLFDTDSGEHERVDNRTNMNAAQGAGIQAATTVIDAGAAAIITGHVGPKAAATLGAANVRIFIGASGTVADAMEQYHGCALQETDSADVEGHWTS